jgi:diaminopimelate epimerase
MKNDVKKIAFTKMHGLGNDYIYVDCFEPQTADIIAQTDLACLAREVSDRHFGIGSDGLVLIIPSDEADARMRIFNADGSEAQMCGNAIRCVGKYLYESGLCRRTKMRIQTLSGIRALRLHTTNGQVDSAEVHMGKAQVLFDELMINYRPVTFVSVNMGNPHIVIFPQTHVATMSLMPLGPTLERHPHFPEGTNVEFVSVRNRQEIDMRVWERGSGETMACGTGACAAAVASAALSKTDNTVTVHLRGGDLYIHYDPETHEVTMRGPAAEVCRGEYYL